MADHALCRLADGVDVGQQFAPIVGSPSLSGMASSCLRSASTWGRGAVVAGLVGRGGGCCVAAGRPALGQCGRCEPGDGQPAQQPRQGRGAWAICVRSIGGWLRFIWGRIVRRPPGASGCGGLNKSTRSVMMPSVFRAIRRSGGPFVVDGSSGRAGPRHARATRAASHSA